MITLTITIGPAPGGVGVNVREDGVAACAVEQVYRAACIQAVEEGLKVAVGALEHVGLVERHDILRGSAARERGEARNGTPGQSSGN